MNDAPQQLIQGTPEWHKARCGSIGSSDAPRIVRRTKTGYSADRDSLRAAKVLERLTGVPYQIRRTPAMLQGLEREPAARMTYALVKGVEVHEVGLVPHIHIGGSHASPDGLIGDDGLIEIKCPEAAAHLETLSIESVGQDYLVQIQWQLACTRRAYCDYVSFNPDFPPPMQLWSKRVKRDVAFITDLEQEVRKFIREIDDKVARLSRRYYGKAAA